MQQTHLLLFRSDDSIRVKSALIKVESFLFILIDKKIRVGGVWNVEETERYFWSKLDLFLRWDIGIRLTDSEIKLVCGRVRQLVYDSAKQALINQQPPFSIH